MQVYDISIPLHAGMAVWPGDEGPVFSRSATIAGGDGFNVTRLAMGAHTGTHLDAPLHRFEPAPAIHEIPAETLVGPALLLDVLDSEAISAGDLLQAGLPERVERLLVRTRNTHTGILSAATVSPGYSHLAADAAQLLAARGVRLLGIDGLSVDPLDSADFPAHEALFRAGIVILEGCLLKAPPAGPCVLVCAPMLIVGADGAPARSFLLFE